jgi:predicted nucleotidyltransferase
LHDFAAKTGLGAAATATGCFSETRRRLRSALGELIPGHAVILFGTLVKPGLFNDASDVDLALETEAGQMSTERLTSELMERLERPVDVVLLNHCHFREKIVQEGEAWTA